MNTYENWRCRVLNLLTKKNLNFAYIGDTVTCIDDFGRRLGGIDLIYAWEKDLSDDEILNTLTKEA